MRTSQLISPAERSEKTALLQNNPTNSPSLKTGKLEILCMGELQFCMGVVQNNPMNNPCSSKHVSLRILRVSQLWEWLRTIQ